MKGPFERLKYDLRRIWECPRCGARQRTDGSETTRFCQCGKANTNPPVSMKLVSDGPRRTVPPIAPPLIEAVPADATEATPTAVTQIEVTQVEVIAVAPVEIVAVKAVDVISPPIDPAEPST